MDATLDTGCGFWEHLYSLREVKDLLDCSKTLEQDGIYKSLRLPIILGIDYVEHGVSGYNSAE